MQNQEPFSDQTGRLLMGLLARASLLETLVVELVSESERRDEILAALEREELASAPGTNPKEHFPIVSDEFEAAKQRLLKAVRA